MHTERITHFRRQLIKCFVEYLKKDIKAHFDHREKDLCIKNAHYLDKPVGDVRLVAKGKVHLLFARGVEHHHLSTPSHKGAGRSARRLRHNGSWGGQKLHPELRQEALQLIESRDQFKDQIGQVQTYLTVLFGGLTTEEGILRCVPKALEDCLLQCLTNPGAYKQLRDLPNPHTQYIIETRRKCTVGGVDPEDLIDELIGLQLLL